MAEVGNQFLEVNVTPGEEICYFVYVEPFSE